MHLFRRIATYLIVFSAALTSLYAAPSDTGTKPFTIVIDAGHGGKDAGAVDNNVREKDINLGVALELQKLIEKELKGVKVVLTRNNDTYLTLQERAEKANAAKGELFISIHTNSVDKSNPRRTSVAGSSVYALGLHKDKNNMAVAMRENSVIELEKNFEEKYSGFDPQRDESYIIFEMAQKKNLSKSIRFADEAQKQLVSVAGRRDRGVHQAGFWVLWATSMPAVLVELDFICNPNSAKYMASKEGERQLAQALLKAVANYIPKTNGGVKGKSAVSYSEKSAEAKTDDPKDRGEVVLAAMPADYGSKPTAAKVGGGVHKSSNTVAANQPRRRRSNSAKAISDSKDYETDSIAQPETAYVVTAEHLPAEAGASSGNMELPKERKSSGKKHDKPKAVKEKKSSNAPQRRDRLKSVYKIQILASPKLLKNNDAEFKGLSDVKSFKENNLYKYTYGESEDRNDMVKLLKEVREKIPDAFIIHAFVAVGN